MWVQVVVPVLVFGSVVTFRTSICSRMHEEFSLCAWKCPPTCVNLQLLAKGVSPCPARWECRVGCRCSAGFLRDEYSKTCIKVQDCPAVAMQASAAPVLEHGDLPEAQENTKMELLREKRSSYPAPVYASPCGAASAPQISVAPPASYAYNGPSVHSGYGGYAAPHPAYASYGGYAPHYRSDEENEMLSFSDMEHMAMARAYGYEAPAPAHYGLGGHVLAPAGPSGAAYGVFPNANVGSCAVPLLLTCSPQITAGKVVKSHQSSSYGAAPQSHYAAAPTSSQGASQGPIAYRGVDEHMMKEAHSSEDHHEQHTQQLASHENLMTSPHDTGHMTGMHS